MCELKITCWETRKRKSRDGNGDRNKDRGKTKITVRAGLSNVGALFGKNCGAFSQDLNERPNESDTNTL